MNSSNNTNHHHSDSLDRSATGLAGGSDLRGDHTIQGGAHVTPLADGEGHVGQKHHDGVGFQHDRVGRDSVRSGGQSEHHNSAQSLPQVGLAGGGFNHSANSNTGTNYGDASLGFVPGLVAASQPAVAAPNNPNGASFDRQPNLDEHLHAAGTRHVSHDTVGGRHVGGDHLAGETRGIHDTTRGEHGHDHTLHSDETEAGRSKTHFPHTAGHSIDGTVDPATGARVEDGVRTSGGLALGY